MATVFWDAKGVIMLDFLPKRSTITGVYYANLLDQLRTPIREKHRDKLSKGVLLQQDNARVHTCKVAMDAVERNGYELIPHPAYSPDLAPSDFFLFWKRISVNPRRFAPKPFPPLVVSPPRRFLPGRFPPSRFAPPPLVVSPPSRFARFSL